MRKRGLVLRDIDRELGLLAVDGRQYTFALDGVWSSELPPRAGMVVDVNFSADGAPVRIEPLSQTTAAKAIPAVHSDPLEDRNLKQSDNHAKGKTDENSLLD